MSKARPREYRTGSVYQRCSTKEAGCPPLVDKVRPAHRCRGRWVGVIEAGTNDRGDRQRLHVTAKTEAEVKRKLRDRKRLYDAGQVSTANHTVKSWADEWLAIKVRDLSPKGYNAAASPIRKWIVPTLGRKRLDSLTASDVRRLAQVQRDAGLKTATAAATQRTLLNMLRHAVKEGQYVPPGVLVQKAPKADKSDRRGMTANEGLACLEVASTLDHGTRWLCTLLYGIRQGEALGLTWDAVDFTAGEYGELIVEWQLQLLPYNVPRDRSSGFRVPDGHEARHLVDSFHLVRPKSKQGYRVAPLLPPVRDALLAWRELVPDSPSGLVWPSTKGRPANDKHDRAEWWGLQNAAGVGHPSGRPYHVHECRNFAATALGESGIPDHVVTSLLGHSTVAMSRAYMTVQRAPLLDAMTRVGERLHLG